MTPLLNILTSYVPTLVVRNLERTPSPGVCPCSEIVSAAVLSADLSGFTALTEYLVQRSPDGVEELSIILNAYFGQLIDIVVAHGGDVVEFTGDGLLAVWLTTTNNEDLQTLVYRAAQCGLVAQHMLHGNEVAGDIRLTLRVGIAAGDILVATVGGLRGRWELLVAGSPISQVSNAQSQASPGEVVLAPRAWSMVQDWCIGYPVGYGGNRSHEHKATQVVDKDALQLSTTFEDSTFANLKKDIVFPSEKMLDRSQQIAVGSESDKETTTLPAPFDPTIEPVLSKPSAAAIMEVPESDEAHYGSPFIGNDSICPFTEMCLYDARMYLAPQPLVQPEPSPEMETGLRAYIPASLLARLDAGQSDWVAELRRVTVLFINVVGIDYNAPDILERLQQCTETLQSILYHYEGSLNQFVVDDKGTLLIAALGLPPLTHEDDAVRGVKMALDVREALQNIHLHCAIGVTTGRIFSGSRGNSRRREYAMIGDVMNLAARLMVKARPDDILCDTTTYHAAQNHLLFETLPSIHVKGKAEPVAIYRPHNQPPPNICVISPIIGRASERTLLQERLQQLAQHHEGGVIVIEGEAGMGKSRLVGDMIQLSQVQHIIYLSGNGNAVEQATPYYMWRSVFSQLYGLDERHILPEAQRAHMIEILHYNQEVMRLAPLLKAVLSFDIPDNDVTAQMSGQVRADHTQELLLHILHIVARELPTLIVLEDANWMDSASWALTMDVSEHIPSLLLVITTRPLMDALSGSALLRGNLEYEQSLLRLSAQKESPHCETNTTDPLVAATAMSTPLSQHYQRVEHLVSAEYRHLLRVPNAHHIVLNSLSWQDSEGLIAECLGVHSVPYAVTLLIMQKAQGIPLFTQEVAYALRDTGLITLENGECHLPLGEESLNSLDLPGTLQGVIVSRIDRLPQPEQLTLKVASVIGETFSFGTLRDVYPIESDKPSLVQYLHALEYVNIIFLEATTPDLTYAFKNVVTQEVVYNTMSLAQRRDVHAAVAEWYEQNHTEHLPQFYERLVYHWSKAEVPSKIVTYAERAGHYFLRNFANEEAVDFLEQALSIIESHNASEKKKRTKQQDAENKEQDGLRRVMQEYRDNVGSLYRQGIRIELPTSAESREQIKKLISTKGGAFFSSKRQRISTMLQQGPSVVRTSFTNLIHHVYHIPSQATLQRSRIERRLAEAYLGLGNLAKSRYHLEHAVSLLEKSIPSKPFELHLRSVQQIIHRAISQMCGIRCIVSSDEQREVMAEAAHIYSILFRIYFSANDTYPMIYAALRCLHLAEMAPRQTEWLTYAYANMCVVTGSMGMHSYANSYGKRALDLAWQQDDLHPLVYALNANGLCRLVFGQWKQAQAAFDLAVALSEESGNRMTWGLNLLLRAYVARFQGEFARSFEMFHHLYQQAQARDNLLHKAWALGGQGQNALYMGRLDEACTLLEEALSYLPEQGERPRQISFYGMLAIARCRQGKWDYAQKAAQKTSDLIATIPMPYVHRLLEGYAGIAEVYIRMWEEQGDQLSVAEIAHQARKASHDLFTCARLFPIGRPRAWLWRGVCLWLDGKHAKALVAWRKSLALAHRLAMPYEEGFAHYEIGRHSRGATRSYHLERACAIFEQLGAVYDLHRASDESVGALERTER